MHASENGHHETVQVLLTCKADVNAKSKVGRGDGGEDAPMGARRPWAGSGIWGQGSAMT